MKSELVYKYLNKEHQKLLYSKKLEDSIQYLENCMDKLSMATLEYNSIEYIIENSNKNCETIRKKRDDDLKNEGKFSLTNEEASKLYGCISYNGSYLSTQRMIKKVLIDFFSYLHSFFDNWAQFLNVVLLANRQKNENEIQFKQINNYINKYKEYNEIRDKISNIKKSKKFKYIEDFNNTVKHKYNIKAKYNLSMINFEPITSIPSFRKGNRIHHRKNILEWCSEVLEFVIENYYDTMELIYKILSTNNHKYTLNRVNNVKYYIKMNKNFKMEKGSYVYIEIDDEIKLNKPIYILISKFDENNGCLLKNSDFQYILLIGKNKNINGVLEIDTTEQLGEDLDLFVYKYKKYNLNNKLIKHDVSTLFRNINITSGIMNGEILMKNAE